MASGALNLFTFADGNPQDVHKVMDDGIFPWWTDPELRLSFFRPLTSLTHVADYALWPRSPEAMHVQSLLWFALTLFAVGWVYRQFLPPMTAGLALLLFAVDDAHGPAVGWIANRNVLVAFALSVPALGWHHRWRAQGWRPGSWLAPLSVALGLLGGEAAIATVGYVAAYAICFEEGPWKRRLLSLAPCLAVTLVWRVLYGALGYGAFASGIYFDPGRNPGAFLAALPTRASALLASQFALPWSDFQPGYEYITALPHLGLAMVVIAAVSLLVLLWVFLPLLAGARTARMFGLGTLFAVFPVCATFSADRLLFFVGIGGMALVAMLLTTQLRWYRRPFAWGLFVIHLVLAPLLLYFVRAGTMEGVKKPLLRAAATLPTGPRVEGKTVVIVNAPSDPLAAYMLPLLAANDAQGLPRLRWLSSGTSPVQLTREDDRTLIVRPQDGFMEHTSEQMMRAADRPLRVGATITLTGMSVEVLRTRPDGRPDEVRVRFDRTLEDPSLIWMKWGESATGQILNYVPFSPPPIGGVMNLPQLDFLKAALAP